MTATVPLPDRKATSAADTSRRKSLSSRPGLDYLMLRTVVFVLIGIGLLMAYSASMASSWIVTEETSVWAQAIRQTLMVLAGLAVFWVALKTPPPLVRTLTAVFVFVALFALVLVLTPVGTGGDTVGSQSWIYIGPISIQPSEIARVAIALSGASMLADHPFRLNDLGNISGWVRNPYVRYLGLAAVMFFLIILQKDFGMAVSFALVVIFTVTFAGISWQFYVLVLGFAILSAVVILSQGGYRSNRFHTYLDALTGNFQDTQDIGFQTYQGFLSLADGGVLGVGLGQSRAKWFYLPEARNDFVFAIVGEELGIWGATLVVVLFALLGIFGIRTALRAQNQFQALMAASITAAVVSQAFVNISYVIGLLPVTGIQLPMISSGGSATIITIGAMGLLCNVARHEPAQISAMQSYGRPLFDRMLAIPEPRPAHTAAPRQKGRKSQQAKLATDTRNHHLPGIGEHNHSDDMRTSAAYKRGPKPVPRRVAAARRRFGQPVTQKRPGRGARG